MSINCKANQNPSILRSQPREYNCNIYATEELMTNPIIECIANYSEARRPEVVEAIAQAIREVPGVFLLDHHSDWTTTGLW